MADGRKFTDFEKEELYKLVSGKDIKELMTSCLGCHFATNCRECCRECKDKCLDYDTCRKGE